MNWIIAIVIIIILILGYYLYKHGGISYDATPSNMATTASILPNSTAPTISSILPDSAINPPVAPTVATVSNTLMSNLTTAISDPVPPVIIPPTIVVIPTSPIYIGCYKDTSSRALPTDAGVTTFDNCAELAKKAGSSYFGLQYAEGSSIKGQAHCFYGGSNYSKYGSTNTCTAKDTSGNILGSSWSNAVYKW